VERQKARKMYRYGLIATKGLLYLAGAILILLVGMYIGTLISNQRIDTYREIIKHNSSEYLKVVKNYNMQHTLDGKLIQGDER
jgi:hypothetical protein